MPSCNTYRLTWVSLTLEVGISSRLLQHAAPYLGRGVSLVEHCKVAIFWLKGVGVEASGASSLPGASTPGKFRGDLLSLRRVSEHSKENARSWSPRSWHRTQASGHPVQSVASTPPCDPRGEPDTPPGSRRAHPPGCPTSVRVRTRPLITLLPPKKKLWS